MKKLFASLLAIGAAGLLSAQEIHFGIGARGQFGFGLGSSSNVAESYATSKHDAMVDAYRDYYRSEGRDWNSSHWDYEDIYDDRKLSVKPFESIFAGGALIGRVSFDSIPGLYLQPEIGYSHNQVKYTYSWEGEHKESDSYGIGSNKYYTTNTYNYEAEGDGKMNYSSIDIPIIVGYEFELGHGMFAGPYGGLSLSIPVGKLSWNRGAETEKYSYACKTTDNDGDTILSLSDSETTKGNSSTLSGKIKNGVIPGIVLGGSFGYKFDQHNMIIGDLRYQLDFIPVKAEIEYKDADLADWNSTDHRGASYTWTEWEDKWFGGKTFNIDAFTRRALNLGVSYVYFF